MDGNAGLRPLDRMIHIFQYADLTHLLDRKYLMRSFLAQQLSLPRDALKMH